MRARLRLYGSAAQRLPAGNQSTFIYLVLFSDSIGSTILFPAIPLFAASLRMKAPEIGLALAVSALGQFISAPYLGRLTDRIGRKAGLLLSQGGSILSMVMLALATSPIEVFLAMAIDGLTGGNVSIAMAYISDFSSRSGRSRAYRHAFLAMGLGTVIGPGILAFSNANNYATAFIIAAFFSILSFTTTLIKAPRRPQHSGQQSTLAQDQIDDLVEVKDRGIDLLDAMQTPKIWDFKFIRNWKLGYLLSQSFFLFMSTAAFNRSFSLFASRRFSTATETFGLRQSSFFYAYLGLFSIFTQYFLVDRLERKMEDRLLVRTGLISLIAGYLLMGLTNTIFLVYISGLLPRASGEILEEPGREILCRGRSPATAIGSAAAREAFTDQFGANGPEQLPQRSLEAVSDLFQLK